VGDVLKDLLEPRTLHIKWKSIYVQRTSWSLPAWSDGRRQENCDLVASVYLLAGWALYLTPSRIFPGYFWKLLPTWRNSPDSAWPENLYLL